MILLLSTSLALALDCPKQPGPLMDRLLEENLAAYAERDRDAYEQSAETIVDLLDCLDAPLDPSQAAALHRFHGIRALLIEEDAERMKRAFGAARLADDSYRFPPSLQGSSWPHASAYAGVLMEVGPTSPLPGVEGVILLDGTMREGRPDRLPVVLQHVDDQGDVDLTRYLWPEDALPMGLPLLPEAETTEVVDTQATLERRGINVAPVVGLVASAVLAGTGGVLIQQSFAGYAADCEPAGVCFPDESQGWVTLNRIGIGLTVAGGVGLAGSGTWLAVKPRR